MFRNILVDLSNGDKISDFFKTASLDDIFDKFVRVSGDETKKRISDFRVGPYEGDINLDFYTSNKLTDFEPIQLKNTDVAILVEKSNHTWLNTYSVLDDSSVKLSDTKNQYQY